MIIGLLVKGAIGAVVLIVIAFLISRFTRDIIGRSLLVISLFVAAGAYFGFAVGAGAGPIWTLVELVQVVVFGTMALLGLRGSAYWIAAGWALHALWDIGLHYIGPGQAFAPFTYAIFCGSFDLVVGAYIAIAYGLIGSPRLGFRDLAPNT
jgi:uncharacterized protein DUF6010